jgi:hypothetical protein
MNTMGIPVLRGRDFAADDQAGTELVTIISKTLAEKLFPDAEAGQAIGKRLIFGNDEKDDADAHCCGCQRRFPDRANELAARAVAIAARAATVLGHVPNCAQQAW